MVALSCLSLILLVISEIAAGCGCVLQKHIDSEFVVQLCNHSVHFRAKRIAERIRLRWSTTLDDNATEGILTCRST